MNSKHGKGPVKQDDVVIASVDKSSGLHKSKLRVNLVDIPDVSDDVPCILRGVTEFAASHTCT